MAGAGFQNESMPNVLIRGLPPDVHAVLTARAKSRGLSLQQYLVGELTKLTRARTIEEIGAEIRKQRGGRIIDPVRAIEEERERR